MNDQPITPRRALAYALVTHVIWGFLPLYLILVDTVPPLEFVAWRTLFTLPICLLLLAWQGQFAELRRALADSRALITLLVSAALIALNWTVYVWAIQSGHVYAASLGYYVLPLLMMVLARLFLDERLTRRQSLAAVLAAAGVTALAAGAITTLWVTLVLALSFGIYGLLRKTVSAGPLAGLAVEGLILLPLVLGYLGWLQLAGGGVTLGRDLVESSAIVASGALTAIPLILFAAAARALPYTVMGFLQFFSPSLVFVLGLTVFGEPLNPAQLICFALIWTAIALFSLDLWRSARKSRSADHPPA